MASHRGEVRLGPTLAPTRAINQKLYRISVAIIPIDATQDKIEIRLIRDLEQRGVAVLLVGPPNRGDADRPVVGTAWLREPFATDDLVRSVRLVEEFAETGIVPTDRPDRLTFADAWASGIPC